MNTNTFPLNQETKEVAFFTLMSVGGIGNLSYSGENVAFIFKTKNLKLNAHEPDH